MFQTALATLILALTPALVLAQAAQPDAFIPGVIPAENGTLKVAALDAGIIHFGEGWSLSSQGAAVTPAEGFPRQAGDAWELRGTYKASGGVPLALHERLERAGKDAIRYSATLKVEAPLATNAVALSLTLPAGTFGGQSITIDGSPVALPEELEAQTVFNKEDARTIVIPTSSGTLAFEGERLDAMVQDDRQFGGNGFSLRVHFNPRSGPITETNLELTIRLTPFESTPIDLTKAANTGFRDEVDADKQGGWTDQGEKNDLRMFPQGKGKLLGGVTFDVIDPAANGGRAAIVLGGAERDYLPKAATVPAAGAKFKNLYLLHASAWTPGGGTPIGTIRARYADGTDQSIEVQAGRDVGNWWAPGPLKNAAVVWTAENASAFVGLQLSKFPLDSSRALEELTFSSNGNAVWMIVAASGSSQDIPLPTDSPTYIVAGPDWQPITHEIDVEPGSALDLSFLVEEPAGKHGHVVVKGPHFEFERQPGKRVRFYGANLCFSANFPDKAEAEKLAERLKRMGYNTIRLHHYDYDLIDKSANDSVTLDPQQLDKLDYLVHCLKQRGLYISIDLYTFRDTKPHEIPEVNRPARDAYKALVAILPSARKNWETFSRNLLTHRNPYTGMTMAEDPVLVGICPLNEDPLSVGYGAGPPADVKRIYDAAFEEWVKENSVDIGSDEKRQAALVRFLAELQMKANAEYFAFLKGLGVRAPLTGVNVVNAIFYTPVRQQLEYVDNHQYHDHPNFPERQWSLPHGYSNRSATAQAASTPRAMFPTRIVGKPFTCTEFNYTFPNRYRAEGGPLIGAYASLQDWDGLWRFAWSHNIANAIAPTAAGGFDIGTDPLSLLSERIAVLMFLRGDVSPAKRIVPHVVTEQTAYPPMQLGWGSGGFPDAFNRLGLKTGVGSTFLADGQTLSGYETVVGPKGLDPDRVGGARVLTSDDPALKPPAAGEPIRSDTGEISLNPTAATHVVTTPRSESFVVAASDAVAVAGKAVTVKKGTGAEAGPVVVYVGSLDAQPIASSKRLLVMHLTDVQNTKQRYRDRALTVLESFGELPHLVRRGTAEIRVSLDGSGSDDPDAAASPEVWALDMAGRRVRQVEARRDDNAIAFTASTIAPDGSTCMVYEIVRK